MTIAKRELLTALLLVAAAPTTCAAADGGPAGMTFFVTSNGLGDGGNLGGLAGADALCQKLAGTAGSSGKTWHAYLSTQGNGAVNARDRIGKGPWVNAKGVQVAADVEDLHGGKSNLTKQTALSEKGDVINGRGDTPNRHDILTGSTMDGRAFPDEADKTCKNFTSNGAGTVMVGHSDRTGLDDTIAAKSWNSSHLSRGPGGGCSQADLRGTGSDGLLYCFAVN